MTAIDRAPKPCLHPRANHQHGTRLAYCLDRCRCLPCAAANSEHAVRQHRQQAYGRTLTGLVDAEPVRAHVQAVLATGVGWKRVARVAKVHSSSVSRLLYGRAREGGRREPPTKRMRPAIARALLAVPIPEMQQLPGGVIVEGAGTARRLQALATVGWSIDRLATTRDIDRQSLDGALRGRPVLARTAQAVAAAYEELWNRAPIPADRFEQGGITRTINRATRAGWLPPAAWDDDEIDDPAAQPILVDDAEEDLVDEHAIDLVLDAQPMRLTGRTLDVAVERLAAAGLDAATIADRVRSDETTVRRIRNTAQVRAARAAAREDAA